MLAAASTEAMLSVIPDKAPRANRRQDLEWCANGKKTAEMLAVWQHREAARDILLPDPGNSKSRRTLTPTAANPLKRVRIEAVQGFLDDFVSQLEVRIQNVICAGFIKTLQGGEF